MAKPKKFIDPKLIREHLHYEPTTGLFTLKVPSKRRPVGTTFGPSAPGEYVKVAVAGTQYFAHRLAWVYVHGTQPDEIDHINQTKDDNRIENLRNVTHVENCQNVRRYDRRLKRFVQHGAKRDRRN